MGLLLIAMMFLAHSTALVLEWLLLLLLVRVVATRWRTVVLTEMNEAARPLVDRTLAGVERMWNQIHPVRPLLSVRRIPVAALALSLVRLLLAAVTGLIGTAG